VLSDSFGTFRLPFAAAHEQRTPVPDCRARLPRVDTGATLVRGASWSFFEQHVCDGVKNHGIPDLALIRWPSATPYAGVGGVLVQDSRA
jgi:hypothetical protein